MVLLEFKCKINAEFDSNPKKLYIEKQRKAKARINIFAVLQ